MDTGRAPSYMNRRLPFSNHGLGFQCGTQLLAYRRFEMTKLNRTAWISALHTNCLVCLTAPHDRYHPEGHVFYDWSPALYFIGQTHNQPAVEVELERTPRPES